MSTRYEIAEIWRYPIKSMGGERIDATAVRPGGMVGDRQWALRHTETGKIISAKRPNPYGRLLEWRAESRNNTVVAIDPDRTEYVPGSRELDQALCDLLGEPVAVVQVETGADETYDSEWPEIPGTSLSNVNVELPTAMMTDKVSFVDLAALHIVLDGSLKHLGSLGDVELGVERFRPNLLIRSLDADDPDGFEDLSWENVTATVGDAELLIADAAPRCIMTTLPQGRFKPAKSILSTLASTARKEFDVGTYACFGTYAEVTGSGTISVGDQLVFVDGP